MVSLSNGSTLKLRNARHIQKLKRNLISVGQLADEGMKTNFDGDVYSEAKLALREPVNQALCEPISTPCGAKKAPDKPITAFAKASLATKWANFTSREAKR